MIDAWIGNLGKYNEGELAGEWVKFPVDPEDLAAVFERIGIDGVQYEEFFLADRESSQVPGVVNLIGEYSNLDEINYLAELLEDVERDGYLDGYNMVVDMEAQSLKDAINLTQCIGNFAPNMDITTETDLGIYLIDEVSGIDIDNLMGELRHYFDYEAYGRDAVAGGDIHLSNEGMYWNANIDDDFYSGIDDIPDESRCFVPASVQNEYLRTAELDTEENYNNIDGVRNNIKPEKDEAKGGIPSLMENLKSNKELIASQDSQTAKPDSPKKDKGVEIGD